MSVLQFSFCDSLKSCCWSLKGKPKQAKIHVFPLLLKGETNDFELLKNQLSDPEIKVTNFVFDY